MMTSKYIAHFLTEVSTWQKKLSTADQVISIYMDVQRTWSHLESIFIGSEDIRNQLPEDSKRFDGIDHDFKVIFFLFQLFLSCTILLLVYYYSYSRYCTHIYASCNYVTEEANVNSIRKYLCFWVIVVISTL